MRHNKKSRKRKAPRTREEEAMWRAHILMFPRGHVDLLHLRNLLGKYKQTVRVQRLWNLAADRCLVSDNVFRRMWEYPLTPRVVQLEMKHLIRNRGRNLSVVTRATRARRRDTWQRSAHIFTMQD